MGGRGGSGGGKGGGGGGGGGGLGAKLDAAGSREAAHAILNGMSKTELLAAAKQLDVFTGGANTKAALAARIYESTVGARLYREGIAARYGSDFLRPAAGGLYGGGSH